MKKIFVLMLLVGSCGFGASISLSFDQSLQQTTAGAFVTFAGTITNTGLDDVFLNGASVALPYFELSYDLTPFFTFSPPGLSPGDHYSGDLFTIAVSGAATSSDYFGALSIQGGTDSGTFDDLASEGFQITVSEESSVPEPSTCWLLASAIAALGGSAGFLGNRPTPGGNVAPRP